MPPTRAQVKLLEGRPEAGTLGGGTDLKQEVLALKQNLKDAEGMAKSHAVALTGANSKLVSTESALRAVQSELAKLKSAKSQESGRLQAAMEARKAHAEAAIAQLASLHGRPWRN